jgi:hypothetical protein
VQEGSLFDVHLQKPNADGYALIEEPFGSCGRSFMQCSLLSFTKGFK